MTKTPTTAFGELTRTEAKNRVQHMLDWVMGDHTLDQLVKSARVTNVDIN